MKIINETGKWADTKVYSDDNEDLAKKLKIKNVIISITPSNEVEAHLICIADEISIKVDDNKVQKEINERQHSNNPSDEW